LPYNSWQFLTTSCVHCSRLAMRASTVGPPATAAVARKIAQKRQELEGVLALQQATELFMKRIEGMCADVDCLADASIGARSHGRWNIYLLI
jgi:hypothetical protein